MYCIQCGDSRVQYKGNNTEILRKQPESHEIPDRDCDT